MKQAYFDIEMSDMRFHFLIEIKLQFYPDHQF
jgi:hypothetical protein